MKSRRGEEGKKGEEREEKGKGRGREGKCEGEGGGLKKRVKEGEGR